MSLHTELSVSTSYGAHEFTEIVCSQTTEAKQTGESLWRKISLVERRRLPTNEVPKFHAKEGTRRHQMEECGDVIVDFFGQDVLGKFADNRDTYHHFPPFTTSLHLVLMRILSPLGHRLPNASSQLPWRTTSHNYTLQDFNI